MGWDELDAFAEWWWAEWQTRWKATDVSPLPTCMRKAASIYHEIARTAKLRGETIEDVSAAVLQTTQPTDLSRRYRINEEGP